MRKLVWIEINKTEHAIRIFKNRKSAQAFAQASGKDITQAFYAPVVADIRHQLWLRCKGECELCATPVTEKSGHMHEQKHRGKGGEISLDNSVFICPKCHQDAHSDRTPHWSKKK
jgi:hypothetical protein